MRNWMIIGGAVLVSVLLAMGLYEWGGDSAGVQAESMAVQDPGPQGRGMRGAGGPGFMPAGRMFFQNRDGFAEALSLLGEASLNPDFDLTREQKERIRAIREEVAAARAKWQKDHAEEFKELAEGSRAARGGGSSDQFQQVMQKRQDLLATAPKTDEAAQRLKATLTPDQLKMLEAYTAERRAADEEMRQQMGSGFGGGPRGGPGTGPGTRPAGRPRPGQQ